MKRLLSHPATNAVCISLFSGFYAIIFLLLSKNDGFKNMLYYTEENDTNNSFWEVFSRFLANGYEVYIVYALVLITALIIGMLVFRRHAYDEYHTSILVQCLVVSLFLTLIAIAVFFLVILSDNNGVVEKFMLFIIIHWVTVVFADLSYVLLCRWR